MEKIHLNGIASVGIAGLGLIGGSMARAVKTYTDCVVCGCDIDPAATEAALAQGAADRCAEDASVFTDSDVVFVALYPQQTIDFVKKKCYIFQTGLYHCRSVRSQTLYGPCAFRHLYRI